MSQEKWIIDGPKVIDVESVARLKVSMIAGQVNIIGHDEPGVRVEVHSVAGRELKIAVNGDTLEVDHAQLGWDNFIEVFKSFRGSARADVSISVPRDVALTFGVVSASALISGLTRDASISTISGDIVVDSLTGALQLNAVNGELSVRDHTGRIGAQTVTGDITASGDINRFTAETVSGAVFLDITGIPDQVRVSTVSGDITTRLGDSVPALYTINTVSGRIQLDAAEIRGVHGQYSGRFGSLEKHWLDFKANTVSGAISVLHSVSA